MDRIQIWRNVMEAEQKPTHQRDSGHQTDYQFEQVFLFGHACFLLFGIWCSAPCHTACGDGGRLTARTSTSPRLTIEYMFYIDKTVKPRQRPSRAVKSATSF